MTIATGRRKPRAPNLRQRRFIEEYLRCDNPRAAAQAAGYAPTTVKQNAANLLRRPSVAAVVRRELDARAERTRIAADRIVLELARVAFSDIGRIADWSVEDGLTVRALADLSDGDRAAVARITRHGGHVTIALHDKIRALDALGKYFKLWGKHADKFMPRLGDRGGRAANGDYTNEQQAAARRVLRQRIEAIVADRGTAGRDAKLREEAEWAAAWREKFG